MGVGVEEFDQGREGGTIVRVSVVPVTIAVPSDWLKRIIEGWTGRAQE